MDDKELIDDFLRGNAEALGQLYDLHAGPIMGYLRGMIGPEEAEDVLQETFIKAGEMLKGYEHRGQLRAWLASIARSRALDRLRKKSRGKSRPFAEGEEENISRPQETPLEKGMREEMSARLKNAVQKLPDRQREVFLLREEAGLSFKEISEQLEVPLNTALSHMHRALQTLREELNDLGDMV